MRLTADLINSSLSYLNPLKERELDLRGHKIPAIENLGVAKDHDAIDFTDNDIAALTNFPYFPRLNTLLLARNRVASLQPALHKQIPCLTTLILPENKMRELADLDPLGGFTQLTHLVLVGNPVCTKEHYRHWILWRCPSVRFLDYQKVKSVERERAAELFGTTESPTTLASKILNIKSRTFDAPSSDSTSIPGKTSTTSSGNGIRVQLTAKERERVTQMLKNATSYAEMTRIEKDLNEGRVPAGVGDEMDVEG